MIAKLVKAVLLASLLLALPSGAATRVNSSDSAARPVDGITRIWAGLLNGDNGDGVAGAWDTAHFQVAGTFGAGGSVQIEGSDDGTTWVKLTPAAVTAAGIFAPLAVNERPKFVRPNVTAGDGTTNLTVTAFFKFRAGAI